MKKGLDVSLLVLLSLATSGQVMLGQTKSQGKTNTGEGISQTTNPGSIRSNAPSGTPAATSDRDTGTSRAEDVGKGKKKGLKKSNSETKTTKSEKG